MRNINSCNTKTDNVHAKSIFSYNVYRTNHQQRSQVRPNNFRSSSHSTSIAPDPEILYMNEKLFQKKVTKTSKLVKECSTQTSKTILQLVHKENGPYTDAQNQTSDSAEPNTVRVSPKFKTFGESTSKTYNPMGTNFRKKSSLNIRRMSGSYHLPGNCTSNQNHLPQSNTNQNPLPQSNATQVPSTQDQNSYGLPGAPPVVPIPQNVSQVAPKNQNFQIPLSVTHLNEGSAVETKSRSVSPMRIGLQIEIMGEGGHQDVSQGQEEVKEVPPSPPAETNQMTPDSLQESPHDYFKDYSMENCPYSVASRLSNFTLDGSCTEQDCVFNTTKTNENFPDKILTRTFLAKSRSRIEPSHVRRETSKSKSFVNTFQHPNYIHGSTENTELRSKQKIVKKSSRSLELPDNSFIRTRRSMRFGESSLMWPTTATQIKSIMAEIQSANSLIPPIRRGKSTSPKPTADKRRFESSKKIPYIDQNKSDVSSSTTLINATRNPELIRLNEIDADISKSECSNRYSDGVLSGALSLGRSNSSFNDNTISTALTKLQELDWRLALRGLGEIVEICRVCDVDLIYGYMSAINQRIIDLLKSPRSHVCRTTCQAVGHLFEYVKDTARPLFEEIVDLLLAKTADANKFIRHDANMALDCMVTHIPTYNSIRALCNKGPYHKNPLVRCATARLLVCAIVIGGVDFIMNPINNECTRKRIILTMARLLEDYKSLETRKLAERMYKLLSKDARFDMYLKKYLEKEQILKIKHTLRIIRKK